MTKRLERARSLPAGLQDETARLVPADAGEDDEALVITPEEEAALRQAWGEMERGAFTEAAVEAVFAKYRD